MKKALIAAVLSLMMAGCGSSGSSAKPSADSSVASAGKACIVAMNAGKVWTAAQVEACADVLPTTTYDCDEGPVVNIMILDDKATIYRVGKVAINTTKDNASDKAPSLC